MALILRGPVSVAHFRRQYNHTAQPVNLLLRNGVGPAPQLGAPGSVEYDSAERRRPYEHQSSWPNLVINLVAAPPVTTDMLGYSDWALPISRRRIAPDWSQPVNLLLLHPPSPPSTVTYPASAQFDLPEGRRRWTPDNFTFPNLVLSLVIPPPVTPKPFQSVVFSTVLARRQAQYQSDFSVPYIIRFPPITPPTRVVGKVIFLPKRRRAKVFEYFNFISHLAVGESILSYTVTASVWAGTDPSPSAILSGAPTLSTPTTIKQLVVNGVLGTIYLIKATVVTSLGQSLAIDGYIAII